MKGNQIWAGKFANDQPTSFGQLMWAGLLLLFGFFAVCVCGGDFITHAHNVTLFPAVTFLPDSQQGATVIKSPCCPTKGSMVSGNLVAGTSLRALVLEDGGSQGKWWRGEGGVRM